MELNAPLSILLTFVVCAGVILVAGVRLTSVADCLADRTGLGEATVGAVLLGAATSLSGLTTSVTAAWDGLPELSVSNAAGGIAAQTLFLAAADIAHPRSNLEHAAASIENMVQGTVLAGCLTLAILGATVPDLQLWHVHPVSIALVAFYAYGLYITRATRESPGWKARNTDATVTDDEDVDESGSRSTARLWGEFLVLAGVTAVCGWFVSRAATGGVQMLGYDEALVGVFATALITSLPELVTTVSAVRRGALTLAVGGIIGGNAFDILFLAASDLAYRPGPLFAAITQVQVFILGLALFMTTLLLMGLLRRERRGAFGIGFETVGLVVTYAVGAAVLVWTA